MGVFPLFALMGVEFQRAVYPLLKPVTYAHQDVIYARGDVADDTYFLRKGTVDVLAGGAGTECLYRINQGQYFGEEVLTNMRRSSHVVSNGMSEMWTLDKEDLEGVVRKNPAMRPKLEEFIALELERKGRLNSLSYRALIGVAKTPERRAALIMQKAWVSHANRRARESSIFAVSILASEPKGASGNAPNPQLNQALSEIQLQLKTMKATMITQGQLLERVTLTDGGGQASTSPGSSTRGASAKGKKGGVMHYEV